MDSSALDKNLPAIDAAATEMLGLFGPGFTGTPAGNVETDIAAAASLAGLMGAAAASAQTTPMP